MGLPGKYSYHTETGSFKTKTNRNSQPYYLHRIGLLPTANGTHLGATLADPDRRHRVYEALFAALGLEEQHSRALRSRGFPLSVTISDFKRNYATLGRNRADACRRLVDSGLESLLPGVPGFYVKETTERGSYWSVGGGGLLIAVRDEQERIVSAQFRLDDKDLQKEASENDGKHGGKYRSLSSSKHGGVRAQPSTWNPVWSGDPTPVVRITEGAIKAHLATVLSGILTLGIPGVSTWRHTGLSPGLDRFGSPVVRVALDSDAATKKEVALQLILLVRHLKGQDREVELELWDPKHKGIDDALVAGAEIEIVRGEAVDAHIGQLVESLSIEIPPEGGPSDPSHGEDGPRACGPHEIIVGTDEFRVNNEGIVALADDPSLYHRAQKLVRVSTETPKDDAGNSPVHSIVPVTVNGLRERLTRVARYMGHNREGELGPVHPPMWSVRAIDDRGCYPGVRRLARVVTTPTIRPDGTILQTQGYDEATEQLVILDRDYPAVPDRPTQEDAKKAADSLLDLVHQFPFENREHHIAYLTAALTPLARSAFCGPSPLFAIDANAAGSGKSLLCTVIGVLLTGQSRVEFRAFTPDDEEMQKRLVPILQSGTPLVILDNIATGVALGGATLDLVLTGRGFRGRILGKSEETASLTLDVTWIASGNNITYGGDTSRRVVPIRLQCLVEKPEERDQFKIPRLVEHVQKNRPQLVVDALTILRAYVVAGRPKQKIPNMASFEGWSDLVRSAVVWATGVDPCATRVGIAALDVRKSVLQRLLEGWKLLPLKGNGGISTSAALKLVDVDYEGGTNQYALLHEALLEIGPGRGQLPDSRHLGNYIRKNRKCVVGGMYFDSPGDDSNRKVALWTVLEPVAGSSGEYGVSNPSPIHEYGSDDRNSYAEEGGQTPQTTLDPANNPAEDLEEGDA